jgi:L-threonylcarbamoyladenylate synthase
MAASEDSTEAGALEAEASEAFTSLVKLLAQGGVAIVPCDTMYGIVGAVPSAEDRIRSIKGRGEEKPFLQLIPDGSWVSRVSDMPLPARLAAHWPGPLTLVVPRREGGTVALRVPDSRFLQALLESLGVPLYSTSVNRAGAPAIVAVAEMRREFGKDVDMIWDAGELPAGRPSTLVDLTVRPYAILRQGGLYLDPEELVAEEP